MLKNSTIIALFIGAILLAGPVSVDASDTTTTEVGATVQQVMTIVPGGSSETSMTPSSSVSNPQSDDAEAIAHDANSNGRADSVTITINPNKSTDNMATGRVDDHFGINANVDFELWVSADTSQNIPTDSTGYYLFDYTASAGNQSAKKTINALSLDAVEIGSSSAGNAQTLDSESNVALDQTSNYPQRVTKTVNAGKYYADDAGLVVDYQIANTGPDNMPAGTYTIPLLWEVRPVN